MSTLQAWCPQCGPIDKVDEDDCCHGCGADRVQDSVVEQIQHSATRDFALVPVAHDDGEMDTAVGVLSLRLADIEDGFTFVGVRGDLQPGERDALVQALDMASRERNGQTRFVVLNGQIDEKYQILRVVTKAAYDEDFDEQIPTTREGG